MKKIYKNFVAKRTLTKTYKDVRTIEVLAVDKEEAEKLLIEKSEADRKVVVSNNDHSSLEYNRGLLISVEEDFEVSEAV